MSYYGQGDYYAAGGVFDVFKGIGKAALGLVTGGPAGAVSSVVSTLTSSKPKISAKPSGLVIPSAPPGALTGGTIGRKRRRMNPANSKALTRANRRIEGFVRLAKRSLKHTNYKLVTKQSGTRRRSRPTIVEHGPGSVRVE